MQFRKSPIAVAAVALFGALPLAAHASGTPYSGTAPSVPLVIPAANFDKGGEGVAYHDLSAGNLGGLYRTSESVDIYSSTDSASGPYQVANFQNGEWMTYTINVPANGNYDLSIRASNNFGTGAFHFEVDGTNVTGTISMPKTGSWTTYQWFGKQGVALTAGTHVVKLVAETQWFNVTALSVQASAGTSTGSTSTGAGSTSTSTGSTGSSTPTGYAGTPYSGSPIALPATFPAANFDKGGEGVGFHDLSSGNLGGLYRTSESVDIYASTDSASGQYQVANFQTGEWMNYTVNVPANGNYDLGIRASNNLATGAFHIEVDGTNVTGSIAVPLTGSWTTYQWFGKKGVALTAGKHVVKLVSEKQWFNVSGLSMLASASTSTGSTGTTTGGSTSTGSTGTTTGGSTTPSTGSTTPSTGSTASKPANMLFWSGFEGALSLIKPFDCYNNGCYQQLTGTDSSTGFSWPIKLYGGDNKFQMISNASVTPTSDTIGSWMYNELQTVVGHKGNQTRALYSRVVQSGCCGTNPQGGASTQDAFHMYPGSDPTDLYISKWLKFQPDLQENLLSGAPWRVVFEWKEGGYQRSGGAFRVLFSVTQHAGLSKPAWQVTWDNDANGGYSYQRYWRTENTSVPVPIGEWFKFEIFWHRSKGSDGRVWIAVNGKVIDDHYGPNIGVANDPIGRIMVNQVYSGAPYPIYQWMDDIQVWKSFPTASSSDPWYDPPYAPH